MWDNPTLSMEKLLSLSKRKSWLEVKLSDFLHENPRLKSPAVMSYQTRQVNKIGLGLSIHSRIRKVDTVTFSEPAYLSNSLVGVVCPAGPPPSFAIRPTPRLCPGHNPPALIIAGILAL